VGAAVLVPADVALRDGASDPQAPIDVTSPATAQTATRAREVGIRFLLISPFGPEARALGGGG
jgi:hypothetical protein